MHQLGGGPPLLMLAGTGGRGAVFLGLARRWQTRRRALMPDPAPPFVPEESARAMLAALDAEGIGACDVLGVSLGGCVAQQMAVQAPDRVRSLTLCATFARMDAAARHTVAGLRDARLSLPDTAFVPLWLDALYGAGPRPAIATMDTPPGVFAAQLNAAVAYDGTAALRSIRCPTRVTYGQDDTLIPPRLSIALAGGIQDAILSPYPGGHMHWMNLEI